MNKPAVVMVLEYSKSFNTVLFVLRLGRNHCYQRQIRYHCSGKRKFRLRRAYPKDYYEESRI